MSLLTSIIILFYNDFHINFSSINSSLLLLLIGIVAPLITGILFATKEIKVENKILFHRTVFPSKWKSFSISDIHHICYYQKPVERFSIFPKVVFFSNENNRLALLQFLIPKSDIYRLLSSLHDRGIPVLFFTEFKNIEETEFYTRG